MQARGFPLSSPFLLTVTNIRLFFETKKIIKQLFSINYALFYYLCTISKNNNNLTSQNDASTWKRA